LGQGIANAVGFSLASKHGSHILNNDNGKVIDHKVYCFCGDGDLQEGISYEACSVAGHQKLDNLVLVYDSNDITIDGNTDITFTENIEQRFRSQNWEVVTIDGHNYEEIDSAFATAQTSDKPFLIIARTKIGKGSASMEGSHKTHGAPLGEEEIKTSKENAGFPLESFTVPDDALERFRVAIEKGDLAEKEWNKLVDSNSDSKELLEKLLNPSVSDIDFPKFTEAKATRETNSEILQAIAQGLPGFIGGSADLASSNKTELKGLGEFPKGRNIRFGIREHSMAAMTNAMANYGLFLPFNSTFYVFSDYSKPAARVAALMGSKNFFIWTHDSIGVGEDGATHQPIEQLSTFRAMPNFYSFRPADGNENVDCWKTALELDAPSGFVLTRQKTTLLDRSKTEGDVSKGGYLLEKVKNPQVTLVASGSEVGLIIEAKRLLEKDGMGVNIVSVPCFDLFNEQDSDYIYSIINPNTEVIAVEMASGMEWHKFADVVCGMSTFGESAPAGKLFEKYGFNPEDIADVARSLFEEA
ncbi:MAG: transketolase, partial [Campylobacterales bacterium]|nr:transketolase [Campylobacterales bacterium]